MNHEKKFHNVLKITFQPPLVNITNNDKLVIELGTVGAQNWKLSGIVGSQSGHKVTWVTVGAQLRHSRGKTSLSTVDAQLRHSWGTIFGQKREKLIQAQLGHSWGTFRAHIFLGHSWGRVNVNVSLKVRKWKLHLLQWRNNRPRRPR